MTETLTLRLTIADPVPGLHYWRQDAKNAPHDIRLSTDAPLTFDMPVDLRPDGTLGGTFVRREGPTRRFVYIAIGGSMDGPPPGLAQVSRRAKIDVHDIPADLLKPGAVIATTLPGRGKDGTPACATVRPLSPWTIIS
ncbi:MAG: hypothetical protein B7Y86_07190 [Brevundimonas subvibrioides]|uniref:Uncharacterized protein n=1 Tax=Brevundimonas subvibrioides TaxID=74313 RepID=A0A258HIX7_9CAUL|nr:DUF5990 family protein [Brevundimonas subvibrioides]OYX56567.1 MAG: hypothetical protein B7Y86_07190 [Brevundimonas subvibrioides]